MPMRSFVPTDEEKTRNRDDMIRKIVSYGSVHGWRPGHEPGSELPAHVPESGADAARLSRPRLVTIAPVLECRPQVAVIPHPCIDTLLEQFAPVLRIARGV